jgi:predicted TIM-barrel fold metal-dependent hydrolase
MSELRIDVHQHVWTEPLLASLAKRTALPLVTREYGVTVLHSEGEQPYVIDVDAEAADSRARALREDGVDLAVVSISSPIGIESLPREQALELIDAHLGGVAALGAEFAAWGPVPLDRARPDDVDDVLARGCVGVSIPAGALAGPTRLDSLRPTLERIAERGAPLFVHPGRGPGQLAQTAELDEPLWWRALTDYVEQMQAAWLTFATFGRREHPQLRVLWSMLAGGAPLQAERLASRGCAAIDLRDRNTYYETSSYGPTAIDAVARIVGEDQLVYGSDRPVVVPTVSSADAARQLAAGGLFPSLRPVLA